MPAWLAAIGPVVQGITGIVQAASAAKAAKNLPEAQKYEATPQMIKAEEMALRRAEQGMSSAERALFEQGMARRTGAAERSLRNLGLAGLGVGMSNIFNIDAMNQFSAQSEAERRRGEAMYAGIAGQMQGIQDRETTSFNQMLNQQRVALGQAAASGMKNITGAAGMASQMIHTEKLAEKYGYNGNGAFGGYGGYGGGNGAFGDFGGGGGGETALDGLAGFGGGGETALDGLAGFSDKRLKYNIIELGHSPSGIPIYSFKYKGGSVSYKGTMAQDLINMGLSDAVTVMSNGYYGVYYDMIDVDMELLN
jgi:hypothetical protein